MRRHPAVAWGLASLLMVGAACSGGTTASAPGPNSAAAAGQAAATPTTTAPAAASCGDPTASLRPPAPMPAPGQMPAGSFMQQIYDRGHLVAGVDQNTLLFGSLNPRTGLIQGFDIDVLRQVAKAIFGDANRIQYKAITSAQRIPFVQAGTVDIVGRTMTITCARIKQVSFSTVYFEAGQKVLVRSNSTAQGIQDLGGQKVCADTGSTSLDNIRAAPSHPVPYAVDDWTDCLVALQRYQVDAISTDDAILAGLAAQDPYTKVVGASFSPQPYGLAMSQKHPDFVQFVNGVLDQMRADGTWKALYNRWLAPDLGPAPPPPPATYSN